MGRKPRSVRVSIVLAALAAWTVFGVGLADGGPKKDTHGGARVLVLLGEWFGDAYFPLKDRIKANGWTLTRVGVDETYRGCYNKARDVELKSDILIKNLKDFSNYDVLVIPSGPQFRKFVENPEVLSFVRAAHEAGLIIAAFCTGNNVVKAAGLVDIPYGPGLFPSEVELVGDRILLGPRGGGPPPGDGFESAPIDEICEAIIRELGAGSRDSGIRKEP